MPWGFGTKILRPPAMRKCAICWRVLNSKSARVQKRVKTMPRNKLLSTLRQTARPLTSRAEEFDALLEKMAKARLVLIGEASHGTHEFYRTRACLTQRLIAEHDFNAVAIEADWPDAYRVNCYVRGQGELDDASEALSGFERFPAWMWRNQDVLKFIQWLRAYNDGVE